MSDQGQQYVWIQIIWHSNSAGHERIFEKVNFEKRSQQMTAKAWKII